MNPAATPARLALLKRITPRVYARLAAERLAEAEAEALAADPTDEPRDLSAVDQERRRFVRGLDQGGRAVNAEEHAEASVDDGPVVGLEMVLG